MAPVGAVAIGPAVERRLELLREAGVRARLVDAASALPILAPTGPALLDEDGGVIRTTTAIRALVAALGDALVADEVVEVSPSGEVRAGGAIAAYDRVIVCAGRDTPRCLAAGLDLPVRVSTHTRYAYPVREPRPLACLQDGTHGAYGDPLPGDRYAIGLGETDPTAYVAEWLPGLEPRAVETRTCWVTELPWGHDGMAVWEAGALRFVAGGNLFKHAPVLGRRLAADDIGELRPELRLGRRSRRGLKRPVLGRIATLGRSVETRPNPLPQCRR